MTETGRTDGLGLRSSASDIELVGELRGAVDRAGELLRVLEGNLREAASGALSGALTAREEDLERRLASADADVKELAARLVDSEQQGGRLMSLYVATYQLHSTLEPEEVQATIAEIAINLLGAESFALLLKNDEDPTFCDVALGESLEGHAFYGTGKYRGGDSMVDAALVDGVLRLGPTRESAALASVPLRVQDAIVGVLVVLKLFDHKPMLRPEDRDLLDLLSAHAASALFAARLFATKERKLKTLESLLKLARGET